MVIAGIVIGTWVTCALGVLELLGVSVLAWFLTVQHVPRIAPGESYRRARRLLRMVLTEDQMTTLNRHDYHEEPSTIYPGRVYRIARRTGGIRIYEGGKYVAFLCAQPEEWIPQDDRLAMHILMIRANEQDWEQKANRLTSHYGDTLERLQRDRW